MENTPSTTELAPAQEGKSGGQILAFLGGTFLLFFGSLGSLGATLLAPLTMLVVSGIWQRRGRKLSVAGHWLATVGGAAIVYVLFSGIASQLTSAQSLNRMRQVADSLQTPPSKGGRSPGWLQRITPGMVARQTGARTTYERAQTVGVAVGLAFGALLWLGFYGSIAWAGGMLIGYGLNGRWPGTTSGAPPPDSPASSLA